MIPFVDPYYVFVPDNSGYKGRYLSLQPASTEPVNGFMVIPYLHPFRHGIRPGFFEIREESAAVLSGPGKTNKAIVFRPSLSKQEYVEKVQKLKRHIAWGDIYEVNFCMEFIAENVEIDPVQIFAQLCASSKAPYNFLFRSEQQFILCSSPELFLKKEGTRLITKPIKGTARRGKTEAEDRLLHAQLYNSIKERTENVMAVDVARNDLSMIAARGSVSVNKLYNIESFETVHQMVSTVSCEIRPGKTFEHVLEATFPMASMTGAPKISAMNLISETENFERGYYSGAMGLCKNGDYELAVIIRSLFYDSVQKVLSFATGGAITHLCDAEKEYEECLLKAATMLKATSGYLAED